MSRDAHLPLEDIQLSCQKIHHYTTGMKDEIIGDIIKKEIPSLGEKI
jgi:uncharacterized protein with HEPN domain